MKGCESRMRRQQQVDETLRLNSSCIATAPTKGGITSGSTPSVCTRRRRETEAHREISERNGDGVAR